MTNSMKMEIIATKAHMWQFRRDGVTPYIVHPRRVAELLKGSSDLVIATAKGHDLFEDTTVTPEDLEREGIDPLVIEAIQLLTKHKGVSLKEYYASIAKNWIAKTVKIADMLANLTDTPTEKQKAKYTKGLLYLCADIEME